MILTYSIIGPTDDGHWSWTLYADGIVLKSGHGYESREAAIYAMAQYRASLSAEYAGLAIEVLANADRTNSQLAKILEGQLSGPVSSITSGFATQKINRDQSVQHHLLQLSEPVLVGQMVDIRYKNGIGIVVGKSLDKGIGR